jgi:phage head maturation protease
VLDDAEDGMISASVGFAALPEHQHWETRSRRKILKAFLDHIGLTFTPVYEGAGVLDVRSRAVAHATTPVIAERTATPNLDQIMLDRLVKSYSHR